MASDEDSDVVIAAAAYYFWMDGVAGPFLTYNAGATPPPPPPPSHTPWPSKSACVAHLITAGIATA